MQPAISHETIPRNRGRYTFLPQNFTEEYAAFEGESANRVNSFSPDSAETPIVAITSAVGNAIFDASGDQIRSMPLSV